MPVTTQEGLDQRSRGALVSRLRRLRHPAGSPAADARSRHRPREHRVHQRHRLQQPLPVLHEHVRHARHPRPRAGHCHGSRRGSTRSRRVGDHRRRRRPVDRWQPLDPRLAAQCQPHDLVVQQPHLRAHQGPVLADVGGRQGHQEHPVRVGRPAVQPAVVSRSAPRPASWPALTTSTAST